CEPPVAGLQGNTSLLSSWLHPLKGWSLRETRGGSEIHVGNVLSAKLAQTRMAKSVLNAG
ncbi:hypothetical protein ACFFGU_01460, partial [Azotobacter chroococcum]|uniref:hypothetical protein n=1 Tax=Azotobacter chroococcum TaxID=353 RepID=UPI0035ED6ADF